MPRESRTGENGNPKTQETGLATRFSCKFDYSLGSINPIPSTASAFFTDDYLRAEHRMGRNYLKGRAGDHINAIALMK